MAAIVSTVYPKGIIHAISGDMTPASVGVKAGLLDATVYAYNAANEVYGDISGVVGTPVALASKTIGVVGTGVFDAADTLELSLAAMAATPLTNSVSPTGFISSGPLARCIERHCTNTVATMLWPLLVSASRSSSM